MLRQSTPASRPAIIGFPVSSRRHRPRLVSLLTLVILLPVLAACGQNPGPPTPPPATLPPGNVSGDATTGEGLPNTGASNRATKDQLTLGALATRMDGAWQGVKTYRATFAGSTSGVPATPIAIASPGAGAASPVASPGATPIVNRARSSFTASREVVLPDRQRQVLAGAGEDDHEAIAIGQEVFVRGPLVAEIAPGTDPNDWIVLPMQALRPETAAGHALGGLVNATYSPLATMPQNLSEQVLRDLGTIEIAGRDCRVWGAANTTPVGTRLDITIAVDNRDLPCLLETRSGTDVLSSVFWEAFNEPITIEAPASAIPVSSPVGETEARD